MKLPPLQGQSKGFASFSAQPHQMRSHGCSPCILQQRKPPRIKRLALRPIALFDFGPVKSDFRTVAKRKEPKKKKVNYSSAWAEARKIIWNARWRLAFGSVLDAHLAAGGNGSAGVDEIHRR